MTETIGEAKAATKSDQWREWIAEQERSGISARQFCKERGLAEQSFYGWRKRLRRREPVRFALVDRGLGQELGREPAVELVLTSGERLRIANGVDGRTLRAVLEALRG
jgi:hypothetical protein